MNEKKTKYFLIGISIWIFLQIPRLIVLPLIADILNGKDNPAWMFPAILDIVVAIASPYLIYAIWKNRNLFTWTFAIIYFIVSIIDHGNAVTASILTPTPHVFGGPQAGKIGNFVPTIQAIVDIFCVYILSQFNLRTLFFVTKEIKQ